ncbi:MAG: 6,7-dimethyl-8-ribityllumazine synthase [Candidatus Eisenbacteria bacterium]
MRSTESRPPAIRADLRGEGRRVVLLVSRYNEAVCDQLLSSAKDGLVAHGVSPASIEVHRVPGAFELSTAASWAADSGAFDAVIGLGCVIKGETDHDVYINHAVAQGFTSVAARTGVPVILGVLTTNDLAQAEARANPAFGGGKGWECALAALEMMQLRGALSPQGRPTEGEGH